MASSRKDKFKKAIQNRIKKDGEGDKPGMQGFVEDMSRQRRGEGDEEEVPVATSADAAPENPAESAPDSTVTAAETPVTETPASRVPAQKPPARDPEPSKPAASRSVEAPAVKETKPPPVARPVASEPEPLSGANLNQELPGPRKENLISAKASPVETVPERPSKSRATPRQRPTMARTRDSVYNVSSDIRLEDYTDSSPESGGGAGAAIRIGAGLVLLVVLLYGIYSAGSLLFAPSYTLAVSSTPLTAANAVEFAEAERVSTAAGQPVYIHFQWNEGELNTDYVKIQVDRVNPGGSEIEEAILARRPPITANYIQFAGPLEVGKYRITVTDRNGRRLANRVVNVN